MNRYNIAEQKWISKRRDLSIKTYSPVKQSLPQLGSRLICRQRQGEPSGKTGQKWEKGGKSASCSSMPRFEKDVTNAVCHTKCQRREGYTVKLDKIGNWTETKTEKGRGPAHGPRP